MRIRRKHRKKFIALLVVLIIFLGLGIGAVFFVFDLRKDKKATRDQMAVVLESYNKFNDSVDKFNDIRNDIYLDLFENTYYDNLVSKDEEFKSRLTEYEKSVDNVNKSVKKLDKLCIGMYYHDKSINAKCNEYGGVYEQIVNAFVSDIKLYNDNIKKYNEYAKENGSDNSLDSYKTKKKYIDYNKDKKFDGKDV